MNWFSFKEGGALNIELKEQIFFSNMSGWLWRYFPRMSFWGRSRPSPALLDAEQRCHNIQPSLGQWPPPNGIVLHSGTTRHQPSWFQEKHMQVRPGQVERCAWDVGCGWFTRPPTGILPPQEQKKDSSVRQGGGEGVVFFYSNQDQTRKVTS